MKRTVLILILVSIVLAGCGRNARGPLISQRFIDDDTFEIVCSGRAAEGTTGIAGAESAKRAALMNAYYYAGITFNDTVAPDRDGRIEKVMMGGNEAVVYYIIKKSNLKKRRK
jgi:nitrous oxide reductase accessory protein NosL